MFAVLALVMVLTATAIIGGSLIYASRNGTLRMSDQEYFDHRFYEIVIADAYAQYPRRR